MLAAMSLCRRDLVRFFRQRSRIIGVLCTPLLFWALIAWRFESVQGFHAIMNLFLIPMWLLSGAVFPPDKAVAWVKVVMKVNPLSYGVDALRRVLTGGGGLPLGISLGVTAAFAGIMFILATALARRR